jgi:hypothetical protein
LVTDASLCDEAEADWQGFSAKQTLALDWFKGWETICEWELPFAKWFVVPQVARTHWASATELQRPKLGKDSHLLADEIARRATPKGPRRAPSDYL